MIADEAALVSLYAMARPTRARPSAYLEGLNELERWIVDQEAMRAGMAVEEAARRDAERKAEIDAQLRKTGHRRIY